MSRKSVFCISQSRNQADGAINQLKYSGFSKNDISILFPNRNTTSPLKSETKTSFLNKDYFSSPTPELVDGALSWISSISSFLIPDVGPFTAAGPIIEAFNDTSVDNITKGLIHIGISECEVKRYEKKIKDGYILMSVYTDNYKEILLAQEIFNDCGARDISTSGKNTIHNIRVSYIEPSPKLRKLVSY